MTLNHGDGVVRPLPDRLEADVFDLGGQRSGSDDEYSGPRRSPIGQQVGGTLGTGDDVVGHGGEPHRAKMLGNLIGTA